MKNNYIAILIFLTFLAISLTSCTREVQLVLEADISSLERNIPSFEQSQAFEEVGLAISNFSQNLFRKVLEAGEENAVFSPLSAYYALTMVALGAREGTLHEFQAVLGENPQYLAPKLASIAQSLIYIGGNTELTVAGSVWVCDRFTVKPEFNQNMIHYFYAYAQARNLSNQSTIDEINYWIYGQTRGLLYNVIKEIDEDIMMMLINTLYLSAEWARAFNPMGESISTFYLECGDKTETIFLSTNHFNSHAMSITNYYEAVILPYDDGRLSFFLVRPTDGTSIRNFAASHDLMNIVSSLNIHHEILVRMPKLDKEFDIEMSNQLKAMGLTLAFDEHLANLQGLVEGYDPIYIYEVRQVARIMVNTEGTEAVAVTIVSPAEASSLHQPIELTFNTPYIYIMFDNKTSAILFMGVVDNPSA